MDKIMIEKLEWDSSFFGLKIGRLIIPKDMEFDAYTFQTEASMESFDLIYLIHLDRILTNELVQVAKLDLVDIQVTMSKKFIPIDFSKVPICFKTAMSEIELRECYGIAEESSIVSRFSKEEILGADGARRLYRKWIDSALDRTFSDGIFVELVSSSIVGIHLVKTDRVNRVGNFTLTGVNSNFKRMGIGTKLWNQSISFWSQNEEIDIVKSPFSLFNLESFSFHVKNGFDKIEQVKYIYHFRKAN